MYVDESIILLARRSINVVKGIMSINYLYKVLLKMKRFIDFEKNDKSLIKILNDF